MNSNDERIAMAPGNLKHEEIPPAGFDPHAVGRILLYTAIITFCAAALASIAVILFGDFGGTEGRILFSSFTIAAYSLAGLSAMARYGRDPQWTTSAGLASAALGLMLTLYLIWTDAESDDLIRVTVAMTVITGALAHANLLLGSRKRADDPASAILTATLVVSAILTSMIVIALLANADPDNGFWKLVAVLAVLLVLGTLVVPITRKIKDVGTLGYSEAAYSAPALLASSKAMEVRYQGRTIHVEVTAAEEQSGFRPHAWIVSGQDRRPLPLNGETSLATDAPTALAHAVRELARAVDSGQI